MKVIFISIVLLILNGIRVYSQPLSKQIFPSSNPQTEISIAIDPTNPQNVLVSCNGGWEIVYPPSPPSQNNPADQPYELIFRQPCFYSVDAGNSWNATNQDFAPNDIETKGDPVVFYNTYGDAFYITMGRNGGILVLKSIDKGGTWGATINADPLNKKDDDKPHAVADLSGTFPNNVYVAWTDFDTYEVILTKSIDRGEHFGNRQVIFPNTNSVVMGVNLQPGPNGELYCIAAKYLDPASQDRHEKSFIFTKSTDGGNNFTNPASIFNISGIRSSNSLFNGARVNSWPSMSVDRSNSIRRGWIYVVYADMHTGDADIYLRSSTDGGNSWSNEIRVNQDPVGTQQFFSSGCVDPVSGNIYISYYNMDGQNYQSSRYLAVSTDGGNTFSRSIISDSRTELQPQVDNMGDYYETTSYNDIVYATWSQYNITSNIYQAFINYPPNVIVDQQIDQNSSSVGHVGFWENNQFSDYFVPKFKNITTSNLTLRATQQVINNNDKYSFWQHDFVSEQNVKNHNSFSIHEGANQFTSILLPFYSNVSIKNNLEQTTVNGGKINFKDPWYIDSVDNSLIGVNRLNRGNDVVWRERLSPFTPNGTNLFAESIYPYNGVFIGQSGPPFWNPPYYTVKVTSPQLISLNGRTHTFYFQNWSGTNVDFEDANALETRLVFINDNAVATANYKGHLLSNNSASFSTIGQRKIASELYTSNRHLVYESQGYVWYSRSTNNGITWLPEIKISEEGTQAKGASIVVDDGYTYILYQSDHNTYNHPWPTLILCKLSSNGSLLGKKEVYDLGTSPSAYNYNTMAVITACTNYLLVVLKPNATSGLVGREILINHSNFALSSLINVLQFTETTPYSVNPSLAIKYGDIRKYMLVYQESYGTIYYKEWNVASNLASLITTNLTTGSPYSINNNPSIVSFGIGGRVCWVGSAAQYSAIVFRDIDPGSSQFWAFGFYASSPSISATDYNTAYFLGWKENGTGFKIVDNHLTNTYMKTLTGLQGNAIQLSDGIDANAMYAMTYNNASPPYALTPSNSLGSYYQVQRPPISKENAISNIASGRAGVVIKESAQFFFMLGDIEVSGEKIRFKQLSDTLRIPSMDVFNTLVESESFELKENSDFMYSVEYGVTDSVLAAQVLQNDEHVKFKVEVIDALSGQIVGILDPVTYSKNFLQSYSSIDYQVNTEAIGKMNVKLKLIVEHSGNASYSITNRFYDEDITLAKKGFKVINLNEDLQIKDYALAQNYPNPFNPVTTITYQLPKSGSVTLKIFDILGNEVKTLVDEQKEMGRYTVQFDASSLASGMYVYQLRANDYTSSKKMMLVK